MSDTPRTDEEVEIAKKFPATSHGLWVSAEFARQLEREVAELREALTFLEQAYTNKHSPQHRQSALSVARAALERKAKPEEKLTLFLCGPSKCEHDYSKYEDIIENGRVVGGTAVCAKCGSKAIDEAMWS